MGSHVDIDDSADDTYHFVHYSLVKSSPTGRDGTSRKEKELEKMTDTSLSLKYPSVYIK